jgi:hypothetical protein
MILVGMGVASALRQAAPTDVGTNGTGEDSIRESVSQTLRLELSVHQELL